LDVLRGGVVLVAEGKEQATEQSHDHDRGDQLHDAGALGTLAADTIPPEEQGHCASAHGWLNCDNGQELARCHLHVSPVCRAKPVWLRKVVPTLKQAITSPTLPYSLHLVVCVCVVLQCGQPGSDSSRYSVVSASKAVLAPWHKVRRGGGGQQLECCLQLPLGAELVLGACHSQSRGSNAHAEEAGGGGSECWHHGTFAATRQQPRATRT
jgi:hypothetical protein